MLFILILAIVFVWLQLWSTALWQPKNCLKPFLNPSSQSSAKGYRWLKNFMARGWWSEPGWVVKKTTTAKLESKIYTAGIALNPREFLGLKQSLWFIIVLFSLIYLWFGEVSWPNSFKVFLCGILLFFLPDLWLHTVLSKRARLIKSEVPAFLDLLTLTLQSGSNLEKALTYTCQNQTGVLAFTLRRSLVELGWGRSLEAIFTDLKTQVPDAEFDHFLSSLLRAKKLGVSLAETLAVQSELLRTRRRQQAEELSRTAAVKMSVPLVLFIFPALLIIYIGPGLLQLMERT